MNQETIFYKHGSKEFAFVVSVFNGVCEIRNNSAKGLLLCRMDRWAWDKLFKVNPRQLFGVIIHYYFSA